MTDVFIISRMEPVGWVVGNSVLLNCKSVPEGANVYGYRSWPERFFIEKISRKGAKRYRVSQGFSLRLWAFA